VTLDITQVFKASEVFLEVEVRIYLTCNPFNIKRDIKDTKIAEKSRFLSLYIAVMNQSWRKEFPYLDFLRISHLWS
jgi:hypothetical protein